MIMNQLLKENISFDIHKIIYFFKKLFNIAKYFFCFILIFIC